MRLLYLLPFVFLSLLPACQQTASLPNLPPPSYARFTPIYMDVGNIEIVEEYRPPMQAPNVEHYFSTTPAEAVRIWVKDRLRTVGGDKTLQVMIKDASVVETQLPVTEGVKGFFTNDQALRYDAKLVVELRIYGGRGLSDASIVVTGTRSQTVPEKASAAQREKTFHAMLMDLMNLMNAELEKNIYQHFGNYISYAPVQ